MEFKKEFHIDLGSGPVPPWRQFEVRAGRAASPIMAFFWTAVAALVKEYWVKWKTAKTMRDVDVQTEALHEQWAEQEKEELKPVLTEVKATEESSKAAQLLGFEELRLSAPHVKKEEH